MGEFKGYLNRAAPAGLNREFLRFFSFLLLLILLLLLLLNLLQVLMLLVCSSRIIVLLFVSMCVNSGSLSREVMNIFEWSRGRVPFAAELGFFIFKKLIR